MPASYDGGDLRLMEAYKELVVSFKRAILAGDVDEFVSFIFGSREEVE